MRESELKNEVEDETKTSRRFLVDLVKETAKSLTDNNPALDKIERGELGPARWREFAQQRYLAALPFEELLSAGIERARASGDAELTETLEANLRDERGIDANGIARPEQAHETWRRDFYRALGVTDETLQSATPLPGTAEYARALQKLIEQGDALAIAGALLVLEGTIPVEFRKIAEGRDKTFPEIFVDQPDDSPETLERKTRARLYIDDHISHDASSHYPDLINALEKHAGQTETAGRIKYGADQIRRAKIAFYESADEIIAKSKL